MARTDQLLEAYRTRRDFSRTAEPDHDDRPRAGAGLSFVIQKHDATRLHYDLRLEWEGVLKSWAVTRGPSLDPAEKRLAVRTEDHPLSYGEFEGIIPKGEYGGGTVMLWDRGTYEPVGDFASGLKEGKLVFRLDGERLRGEWTLVRMRAKGGEKRENWLLIKHREDGRKVPRGELTNRFSRSVSTNRTMTEIAKQAAPKPSGDRKRSNLPMPRWREPQLATLVAEAPSGGDWLAEMKYDGYRALVAVGGGKARIFTRNGKDWTAKFPGIAEAAAALKTDATLLDGEIVAFDRKGKTDFSSLQKAIKSGGTGLTFFAFDLLEEGGRDMREQPLVERKERLAALLGRSEGPILLSTHVTGHAADVLERLCESGHEGIVAKRADAPYRSGRGRAWLKVKCTRRQEFVIGGWTASSSKGRAFASLLLGAHEDGKLVYKGRVGSFEGTLIDDIAPLLQPRARKTSPFADLPRTASRGARLLRPDLVLEVDFSEFTADGVVRHGVARGLREDKDASEVVLEKPGGEAMDHESRDSIAGIKLSNPDKVLFPGQGVTKADLAAHYERVAERMLPLVEGRLISLVRCPEGTGGQCFFQKHDAKGFPAAIRRTEITESDGDKATYLGIDDLAGLVAAVQMGTLEFHIWGSRSDRLENPDRLVFDLDPDEGLGFAEVRDAAFAVRDRLKGLGLETLPLVTGGKGIHVIAPLARRAGWEEIKTFARGFAALLAREEPERYVATMSKEKRKGRIFVDWLRNQRGSTAIAPYSTRARKGAPIATPVSWDELAGLEAASAFRIEDMPRRLREKDPWSVATTWNQSITRARLAVVTES